MFDLKRRKQDSCPSKKKPNEVKRTKKRLDKSK